MDDRLKELLEDSGWTLWERGGECYFEGFGDDRVRASAEIDGHAEGMPQRLESVFIALDRTQSGPVKYATVTWGDFILLTADLWYHYLRGLEMADVEAGA